MKYQKERKREEGWDVLLLLLLLLLSQPLQWLQVHRHRHNIFVASAASCDPEKDHDEKHLVNSCITKS